MANDYISREAAKYELCKICREEICEGDVDDDCTVDCCKAKEAIDKTPAADVVEVVRCKDCYHSSWNKYSESLDCYFFADGDVEDDDFCSRAKMKGGTE